MGFWGEHGRTWRSDSFLCLIVYTWPDKPPFTQYLPFSHSCELSSSALLSQSPIPFSLAQDSVCVCVCVCVCAKSLQSCPTPCDPMDCSPPGSSAHEILQLRILEWVAISFSRGSSWPRDWTCLSCIEADSLHCKQILCIASVGWEAKRQLPDSLWVSQSYGTPLFK